MADQAAGVLRCPGCGDSRSLPLQPVFVVTGASGSGKSAVADGLRRRLPECEVFDADLILHVAELGWDSWCDTWLLVAHGVALNGRATVLCGSLRPEQVEALPARALVGDLRFCNLDCPDDVLAARLRARPAWRGWDGRRIAEQLRFAVSLRSRIDPTFDTGAGSVDEVAGQVAGWVAGHLRR